MIKLSAMYGSKDDMAFADRVSFEILKALIDTYPTWLEVLEALYDFEDENGSPAIRRVTANDLAKLNSLVLLEQFPRETR